MPAPELVLLVNAAATVYMVGVIWIVQLVHYPLKACIDRAEFTTYQQRATARITWVVGPPMLIEAATALYLCAFPPEAVPGWTLWTALALVFVVWISTATLQVPCHNALARGFDAATHRRLVRTNWIRTTAWTLRGALCGWMLWIAMTAGATGAHNQLNQIML